MRLFPSFLGKAQTIHLSSAFRRGVATMPWAIPRSVGDVTGIVSLYLRDIRWGFLFHLPLILLNQQFSACSFVLRGFAACVSSPSKAAWTATMVWGFIGTFCQPTLSRWRVPPD